MLRLYHAPRTRSVRVLWLLEELALPVELVTVPFKAPSSEFFVQETPLGKIPTLEDEGTVLCESGAIVEYLLERYGEGRLAPGLSSPLRGRYLQWLHFAEGTAYLPLGVMVWLTRYRDDAEKHVSLLEDLRHRAAGGMAFLEQHLGEGPWLLGDDFSAADVMTGFTLTAARNLGVLDDRYPGLMAYIARLEARPAYQRAVSR